VTSKSLDGLAALGGGALAHQDRELASGNGFQEKSRTGNPIADMQ
jgi:hypothetical protein